MNNLYFALAIYAALAIALGFGLWLYLMTRREIKKLRSQIVALDRSPRKLSEQMRAEIARLDRQGKSAVEIAGALAMPLAEVELLLKISKRAESQEMMRFRTA